MLHDLFSDRAQDAVRHALTGGDAEAMIVPALSLQSSRSARIMPRRD